MESRNLAHVMEQFFPHSVRIAEIGHSKTMQEHIDEFPSWATGYYLSERGRSGMHYEKDELWSELVGRPLESPIDVARLATIIRNVEQEEQVRIRVRAYIVAPGTKSAHLQVQVQKNSIKDKGLVERLLKRMFKADVFRAASAEKAHAVLESLNARFEAIRVPPRSVRYFLGHDDLFKTR